MSILSIVVMYVSHLDLVAVGPRLSIYSFSVRSDCFYRKQKVQSCQEISSFSQGRFKTGSDQFRYNIDWRVMMYTMNITHPVAPWRVVVVGDYGVSNFWALSLGALDAPCPVLPDAARRVSLLQTLLVNLAVKNLVPPHAGGVLGTKVDQVVLKIMGYSEKIFCPHNNSQIYEECQSQWGRDLTLSQKGLIRTIPMKPRKTF